MDRYRSRNANAIELHQHQIWDTISEYRYLAPLKMARDENRNRLLAKAELSWVFAATDRGAMQPWPLMDGIRNRVGQALIRLGTQLCGTPQPIPSA
jgi:hypothetical protein